MACTQHELRSDLLKHYDEVVRRILQAVRKDLHGGTADSDFHDGLVAIDKADLQVRQHLEDLLQMHEAVAKMQRAEALAQQQADMQQSLRYWQRRLQVQAAQKQEEHECEMKELEARLNAEGQQARKRVKEMEELQRDLELQQCKLAGWEKELRSKAEQLVEQDEKLTATASAIAEEKEVARRRQEEAGVRERCAATSESRMLEQRKALSASEHELSQARKDLEQQRGALAAQEADLQRRSETLDDRERSLGEQFVTAQRLVQRDEALAERLQLAATREQGLLERETAVAAREEEVTLRERALREDLRRSRHADLEEGRRKELDQREASLHESAQKQAEEKHRLEQRERSLLQGAEALRRREAATAVAHPQSRFFVRPPGGEADPELEFFSACECGRPQLCISACGPGRLQWNISACGLGTPQRCISACGPGEPQWLQYCGFLGWWQLARDLAEESLPFGQVSGAMAQGSQDGAQGAGGLNPQMQEQVDTVVRQRLEQAFGSVFGKVLTATQRAAEAAEKQATANKAEGITKALKLEAWKPSSREDELKTWREWSFQLSTWLIAHDDEYEGDLEAIDVDVAVDHALLDGPAVARSQKLFGVLCNVLRNRPLLIVRAQEKEKNGFECIRLLRREMEPKERSRSLAIVRQLAAWTFKEGNLHEQIIAYEDAVKGYESSSGKSYPEDLQIATITSGLKEPLRSQVQLRMTSSTRYSDLREWVLHYEAINTPWSSSLPTRPGGKAQDHGPAPMEIDRIKGNKGKDPKGKGKGDKGKEGKGKDGRQDSGKGKWNSQADQWKWNGQADQWKWNSQGDQLRWSSWKQKDHGNQPKGGKGGKGGGKGKPGTCHLCGQTGHWKNECPNKGGKGVRQVEEASNLGGSWNSNQSSASTSASAVRTPSTVNQVSAVRFEDLGTRLGTPPSGYNTVIYDMTELDSDPGDFSLEGLNIMMVAVVSDPEWYSLDSSDGDDEWTYSPEAAEEELRSRGAGVFMVKAARVDGAQTAIVVDSGADISVAPLRFRRHGTPQPPSGVQMQDAQGKQIVEDCTRALTITTRDSGGNEVVIREKFAIAAVNSVILSLGRLLRSGWVLGHGPDGPTIARGGNQVPIWLKRNTLMLTAVVSTILACDAGALPPEAEDAVQQPGWAILPSGLPLLTLRNTKNVSLETSLWEADDWSHMAIFVRKEPATRKPQAGDVWLHVMSGHTLLFPSGGRTLAEIEPELVDSHDVAVLFHVEELGENLLSNPGALFKEPPADEPMVAPADQQQGDDDGRGVWAERDVAGQGPEEDEHDNMIDDVELSLETPLHVLKDLCRRLGVATSGSKAKVLRRLRTQKELLAKQLATEVAKKMFDEAERSPDIPVAPVLPSARQQALHAVTHQPFAAWCPACVLGRSRQSPHKDKPPPRESPEVKEAERRPVFQIDYFYTFTKERGEDEQQPGGGEEAEETEPASKEDQAAEAEKPDYRDQFGLNLVAGESTSGWITAVPVLAKGSTTLKRVAETLVRTTMQIAGAEDVVLQSDAEPAAKQVVHAVQACRVRLGLRTEPRFVPRASHASNGVAEKAVSTVRRLALTLKAHVEDRAKIKLSGQMPLFSWIMAHAAFLHNRFFTTCKGLPPYEVINGRRYRGQLVQFGECCVGFCPTKYKGDLQWRKGVWAGINEKNGSHILLSDTGAFETRSLRRLPEESQWVAEQIVTAKGLPWDYGGSTRRKRALYTSRAPVLPDSTTLEELAKAAGRAAAETIAAATPRPAGPDEAGSDPSSSTSDSSSPRSSGGPGGAGGAAAAAPPTARDTHGNQQAAASAETGSSGHRPSEGAAPTTRDTDGNQQAAASRDLGRFSNDAQTSGGPMAMEVAKSSRSLESEAPPATPKRPRLLLDRPPGSSPSAASPGSFYPPGFAGVRAVHGDVCLEEASCAGEWLDEVGESLWEEAEPEDPESEVLHDGEKPPEVTPEELLKLDLASDRHEVERLMQMGAIRHPKTSEDLSSYSRLTTKVVRDWRKRPTWVRRSRLVAREFKSWSPWTQDLFAPASSLAICHGLIAQAQALGLELTTLDVKDAYLNVPQKAPVVIEIDSRVFEEGPSRMVPFVLERLLPGQRVAAGEWFGFITGILKEAGLESFPKEPTLFRGAKEGDMTSLVLHADDGLLASTSEARARLKAKLEEKVVVQFSKPALQIGDEFEFLKRRYVSEQDGVVMFSNNKHLEGLVKALGAQTRFRDTPADNTFLEKDTSQELPEAKARVFRECLGRLLYLSHSRPDVQFATCALASSMAKPTTGAMKKLCRTVGYLAKVPVLG
ncbi:unnamed protein product [Symbiodinium sp. KB8]|nr:unnamed protein product [Symbiodinium sp. KB8]